MITQRPSELSDTCISQCANFVVLRTLHPVDLKYIKEMVPNVSSEIVLQLKNLKPGNCIAFGSAFKVPTSMYIDLPNPRPLSNNVDLENVWYEKETPNQAVQNNQAANVQTIMQQQIRNASTQAPVQQQVMSQQPAMQAMPKQQVMMQQQMQNQQPQQQMPQQRFTNTQA